MGFQSQRAPRNRAFHHALVSYVDGSISIKCVVAQLSDTGAQLKIENSIVLPERFTIKIPQKKIQTTARLVWRRGDRAGIALIVEEAVEFHSREVYETARLAFLMAENVQLKAQLGVLVLQVSRLMDE